MFRLKWAGFCINMNYAIKKLSHTTNRRSASGLLDKPNSIFLKSVFYKQLSS